MENATKVGVAVATGYLLGRSKKAKLALSVGAWMMGRRFSPDMKGLVRQGLGQLASSEEVGKLAEEVRRGLFGAARAAAATALTDRVDRFTDALHDRTQSLREVAEDGDEGGENGENGEGEEPGAEDGGQERQPEGAAGGDGKEQKGAAGGREAAETDRPRPRRSKPPGKGSDSERRVGHRRRPAGAESQQPDRPPRKRTSSAGKTSRERSGGSSKASAGKPARPAPER